MNKKFSKLFAVVLVVAMLASQMAPVFATTTDFNYCSMCGENGIKNVLLHTIEPTCEPGYEIWSCKNNNCKGTITERIEATGEHTPNGEWNEAVAPTCTENGTLGYQLCSVCDCYLDAEGNALDSIVDASEGHQYKAVVTDPDCLNGGYTTYTCTVCGDTYDGDNTECLGHDFSVLVPGQAATCREPGYTDSYKCSRCDAVDPERAPQELPIENHNLHVADIIAPTCSSYGYNIFKCEKETCPYFNGIAEEIPMLPHTYADATCTAPKTCTECGATEGRALGHKWADATCTAPKTCSVCGATDGEALGHNLVTLAYQAPTCRENGLANTIVCDRCDYIHHPGEVIPALGHNLIFLVGKEATCEEKGAQDNMYCDVCKAHYPVGTENDDLEVEPFNPIIPKLGHKPDEVVVENRVEPTCTKDGSYEDVVYCLTCGEVISRTKKTITKLGHKPAEPVIENLVEATCVADGSCEDVVYCLTCGEELSRKDRVLNKLGHDYELIVIEPTCTKIGYKVYTCKRSCGLANNTYSEEIPATGHSFEPVEAVAPTCTEAGIIAHNMCLVCEKLFATDADPKANPEPLDVGFMFVEALGHKETVVNAVDPTYNTPGQAAGTKCERCDIPLVDAEYLEELKEAVKFHYDIAGVNGSNIAVNSGYVTINVYFDVLKDIADVYANSDVLANIFAVDFEMDFKSDVFELTNVAIAPDVFAKYEFTPLELANEDGKVTISQDGVTDAKVFRGENILFATLTFQVAADACEGNYDFNKTILNVVHPDEDEVIATETSQEFISIEIKTLGDANNDGVLNARDTLILSNYIKNATLDTEYVAEYDLDKDGDVDFIDMDLLRMAIVGNNKYLTIIVDPNAL